MPPTARKTPLDIPREVTFAKHYSTVICADGTLLPIEERLGRRLLRSVRPESREGKTLLTSGRVMFTTSDGSVFSGLPLGAVYDKLRDQARTRLLRRPSDPDWRSTCLAALEGLERRKRSLRRDQ